MFCIKNISISSFYLFICWSFFSFAEPENGEKSNLQGFLYKTKEGVWILSPLPHLKSCCVGASERSLEQVILDGEFSEELLHREVCLQGFLMTESNTKKLLHAELIQDKKTHIPWYTLIFGGIIVLFFVVKRLIPKD
ncbi:MAG: hypothetical protein P4L16_06860 [Chlamydiales bacterium]|nr:hypothetical protein [Chlamydiales bacterium]